MDIQNADLRYYINIGEDGSFENMNDQILYVKSKSEVRMILNLKTVNLKPYLLMRRHIKSSNRLNEAQRKLRKQFLNLDDPQLPIAINFDDFNQTFEVYKMELDQQGDYYTEIKLIRAGSQFFRLVYLTGNQIVRVGNPNYFVVEPKIQLQSYTIQTVLPYSLGKFKDWFDQLESQLKMGYKAFHFPPIQQLGQSGSLYSINDQLKLNTDLFGATNIKQLKEFVGQLHSSYQALFFVDILLNHTSYDSEWLNLESMRDATYHIGNTPQLACAIELDIAIGKFSNSLANNEIISYNCRNEIHTEQDVDDVMKILENEIIAPLKLYEFFQIDIEQLINQIQEQLQNKLVNFEFQVEDEDENIFLKNPRDLIGHQLISSVINLGHKRFGVSLKMDSMLKFLTQENCYKQISVENLRSLLIKINQENLLLAQQYIKEAIEATRGQLIYLKLNLKENNIIRYSVKGDKLVPRYFTQLSDGRYVANNGWISNYDPLKNFAETYEHHYFRRSIVIWGDLVKLRYGQHKRDSKALWDHMKSYVQETAGVFHGLRLDNAHSTPQHVGEYMMRKAREVNPQILVFAELFTGSPVKDALFCKQLGLNALVRETNRCFDGSSLHGSLHYFSGNGVNSIGSLPESSEYYNEVEYKLLRAQYSPSLVYEQSHDNETLIQSHGFKHQLPISALIAYSKCMKGTVRGYDDYFQDSLSVVSERRVYPMKQKISINYFLQQLIPVTFRIDLNIENCDVQIRGSFDNWYFGHKMILSHSSKDSYVYSCQIPLHQGHHEFRYIVNGEWTYAKDKEININGNHEVILHEYQLIEYEQLMNIRQNLCHQSEIIEKDYPSIHVESHNNSIVSIARASKDFSKTKVMIAQPEFKESFQYPTIELPGVLESIDSIWYNDDQITYLSTKNNLHSSEVKIYEHTNILQYADIYYNGKTRSHILKFTSFPKSMVIMLTCNLQQIKIQPDCLYEKCIIPLDTNDINFILFSTEAEEIERSGTGLYNVPNQGKLVYAGFYGVLKAINDASKENNLSHPLMENLRQGDWLIEYLVNRLHNLTSETSQEFKKYVQSQANNLKNLPRYLIPAYFSQFVLQLCALIKKRITFNAHPLIQTSRFFRELSVASYQFIAQIKSASFNQFKYSLSAGHPHFTTGWTRVWGRDCFISLTGTLLLNHLYPEAKEIILQFASCERHGLLPNLLDSSQNPRYNNRDACWWFMKALKQYLEITGDIQILQTQIKMRFLSDDMENNNSLFKQGNYIIKSLEDIIQGIFQKHASGILFREWKAGKEIDQCMETEGFNINLKLDVKTGFIIGGNWRNCLTWMDKMGSSELAENKGYPATSRDGAPIEMTALCKLGVDLLVSLHQKQLYKYDGVILKDGSKLTYEQWSLKIQQNFERNYWVPESVKQYTEFNIDSRYIKRNQIYKDVCFSCKPRSEYQLRCNVLIAMAVAPELFSNDNALKHLQITEKILTQSKSLGIKTLDIDATEFVSFYDNSDNSTNFKIAQGFSYHNGPEWVWIYGYFLLAMINMQKLSRAQFYSYLSNHKRFIFDNEWYSLPEMTNANGEYNIFSCRAQAWSIGCILEAIVQYETQQQQQ